MSVNIIRPAASAVAPLLIPCINAVAPIRVSLVLASLIIALNVSWAYAIAVYKSAVKSTVIFFMNMEISYVEAKSRMHKA
jgi:hypothetical protein